MKSNKENVIHFLEVASVGLIEIPQPRKGLGLTHLLLTQLHSENDIQGIVNETLR